MDDSPFDDFDEDDPAEQFLREAARKEAAASGDLGAGDAPADGGGDGLGGDLLGMLGLDQDLGEPDTGGGDQLAWRETYFVLFRHDHRPTLTQVEGAIADTGPRLRVENLQADEDGLFQSLLVHAPEDNAALEISYEFGEAVMEQSTALAKSLGKQLDGDQLATLLRADARLDVMHFERVQEAAEFDDEQADPMMLESLDPATLITVVEALSNLTDGLPIDPAAGELLI